MMILFDFDSEAACNSWIPVNDVVMGGVSHSRLDYAGGRKLSAIELRQLFGSPTEQARGLHGNCASAIREKAGSLNLSQLLPLIRGQQ